VKEEGAEGAGGTLQAEGAGGTLQAVSEGDARGSMSGADAVGEGEAQGVQGMLQAEEGPQASGEASTTHAQPCAQMVPLRENKGRTSGPPAEEESLGGESAPASPGDLSTGTQNPNSDSGDMESRFWAG